MGLRVLIVDDSPVYRKILKLAVEEARPGCSVDIAENAFSALEKVSGNTYDAVLMDINMPDLDGLEALQKIKSIQPKLPVIMITGTGYKLEKTTKEAMEQGAMDLIVKPLEHAYEENLKIIGTHLKALLNKLGNNVSNAIPRKLPMENNKSAISFTGADLIVVASSTGGPVALDTFFKNLDSALAVPILVVQHMPPEFTLHLAQSLDKITHYQVKEGKTGNVIRTGEAYIAPGGYHMKVGRGFGDDKVIILDKGEESCTVKPSADVMFRSVAREYEGKNILAVVLSGMGNDGTQGVKELKHSCRTYTICQNEESCVVFGMPRCVYEEGLADEMLDINDISRRVSELVRDGHASFVEK